MRILAVNTVGPTCEAGVWEDDSQLSHVQEDMRNGHDKRLPLLTKKAIEDANIEFSSIDRVAVVAGPGSFTGVRVGVAFARGLGVALNVPVVGINSLEAALPKGVSGKVLIALPARRREPDLSWWAQIFDGEQKFGEALEADRSQMQDLIADADHVFGEGLSPIENLSWGEASPLLSRVANRAFNTVELDRADPQYIRAPDAVPMKKIGD